MGCNCGKNKRLPSSRSKQTFALRMPNGDTSTHGSRLEAEAANVRKGGGGKVQPKR
jgi:hypothetical protein